MRYRCSSRHFLRFHGECGDYGKNYERFLWDGADGDSHCHMVAWDLVCKPKKKSLGIGRICLKNKTCWESGGGGTLLRRNRYGRKLLFVNMGYRITVGTQV